ncbi:hypothetical protein, conserved [Eimeria brunetti]|uniref:Uncharacterized protein n=1 Tax=Eimeria brunetti TaxID=51314 RepID=U6L7D6_9EIME|nr:hypothetical protein, conserved [Eimeria brunetti]
MSRLLRGVVALLGFGLFWPRAEAETPSPQGSEPPDIKDASDSPSSPQASLMSQAQALTSPVSKVGFSLLYPTLSPKEPILLPEDIAARDEAKLPISQVYKVHVVSDCVFGRCYFRPVSVYIQPTNWFVEPDKASLESLTAALKEHALRLLSMREKAASLHRNFLVRKPASWLSSMKARLVAGLGAVCFMQPAASPRLRVTESVRLLRTHKQARLNSLFDSSQTDQVFVSAGDSLRLDSQVTDLKEAVTNQEEYRRALEQAPQNVFGLCRKPRSTMLRHLADKGFVLCTVVLRKDQHVVDRCGDVPVDDIHTMQAIDTYHRSLGDSSLPMLGYVPTSLPVESAEAISSVLKNLERPVPPTTLDEASGDPCVTHISRELQEIEDLHALELWRTAEMDRAITSEMVLRSMVKFAHFRIREIAPETSPEYRLSLLKLANKWSRTTELLRKFNEAVASCPNPTNHVKKYVQEVSQTTGRILDIALDAKAQWGLVRTVMVVPFWHFAFGKYTGPAEKKAAFELGYGLCPYHLLNFVLAQLSSSDNAVRSAAEDMLSKTPMQQLLPALAAAASAAEEDASNRQLAAVLVRRYAHSRLKDMEGEPEEKEQLIELVMGSLVAAFSSGVPFAVRKAAAEAIGELWQHLPSTETISRTAPFVFIVQWLDAQQAQGHSTEDECLLWLLIDRLAGIADPEVYVQRTPQIVQKLNLTFQQLDVKTAAAAEDAMETLFVRTTRWKAEEAKAKEAKKTATAAYCSLCPVVLQMISRQPSPDLLAPLVSLAERGPQFFRDQHAGLLGAVKAIFANSSSSSEETEDTRRMALQLAAGAFLGAPKFSKKVRYYRPNFLRICEREWLYKVHKHMPLVDDLLMLLADAAAASPSDWEDLTAWEAQAREEETGEETLHSVALHLMADVASMLCSSCSSQETGADGGPAERGASSTGGLHVLAKVMSIFSLLVEQEDPRYSYTALELLALLLDDGTCRPLLGPYVDKLTVTCTAALKAADARLRWQGLRCLGSMVENEEKWTRQVQQQHGEQLMSLLSEKSADDPSVRCRRQALLALASLLSGLAPEEGEDPSPETLAFVVPHMNGVLSKAVIAGCSSNDMQTQEFALALASALAKACGSAFIPHYPPFIVALRNLLGGDDPAGKQKVQQLLEEHSGRCLLQAAVEFAADLGAAVGKDVLKPDAPWLVDRLHSLLLACEAVPAASAVFSAIMACLAVAAPACGPELLQQMQPLMDIVLRKAQLSIEMGVAQEVGAAAGSLNAKAELSEEGGVSQFRVQDKSGKQTIISINTAAVEERLAALRLLGALASAVGAAAPIAWGKEWIAAALDGCSSEFSIVRSAAFEALPGCLTALASAPEQQGQATTAALELVAFFLSSSEGQLPPSAAAVAAEHVLPAVAQIVADQAKRQREGMLPEECKVPQAQRAVLLEKLFVGMGKLILPVLTREFERLATREQQDDEWEDVSDDDQEDDTSSFYDAVMQCSGNFFKVYGSECLPHFDAHLRLPYGALLAHDQSSYYGKVAALCLYADAINYGDPAATLEYSKVLVPAALLAVSSQAEWSLDEEHMLAISASSYGLGVVAQRHPDLFASQLQGPLETLERCIANPLLRSPSGRAAADGTACALLKVYAGFYMNLGIETAFVKVAALLETWFPLVEDEQEIYDAHELLLQMVIQDHLLSSNPAVRQQLRRLIVDIFPNKPELIGERARHELLQAAKEKLC